MGDAATSEGRIVTLYTLVGIPGSGKSTLATQLGLPVVSTDAIREELGVVGSDVAAFSRVYAIVNERLEQHLARGEDVVFDATNLTGSGRRRQRRLAERLGARQVACLVDVEEELARTRNRARPSHFAVAEEDMDRYVEQFSNACRKEVLEASGYEVLTPEELQAEVGENRAAR